MIFLRSALVFFFGLLVSALVAWHQSHQNEVTAKATLTAAANAVEDELQTRIRLYEYGLRGARGVIIVTAGKSDRALFRRYAQSRELEREFPGARGFGFIRRVPATQVSAFLAEARADGSPDFSIRQLGPSDGELFVIQYIEPQGPNQAAVGLNIRSEANRRQAAETAMLTGRPTLTAPITLVQKSGEQQRSLLLLLPVYRDGVPVLTPEQRAAACIGWSYTPLALSEVLADFALQDRGIHMVLRDVTDSADGDVFFDSNARDDTDLPVDLHTFEISGRKWRLEARARTTLIASLHAPDPMTVLGVGASLSLLLSTMFGLILFSRARKLSLDEERAQLAAIVENSADAIIGESMDGKVLSWNEAAARLFGFSREEVLGKALAAFFLPPDRQLEDADLLKRIQKGESIPPFDAIRVDKSGQPIDVSIAAGAIRAEDGRLIGVAKLVRDIRERKETERQLKEFNLTLEEQIQARTSELETARRDLRNVLDAVPSMIGYWDADLCNRFANKAYVDWFGKQPHEILGLHIRELLGERIYAANLPYMEAALRGQAQQFERTLETPSGRRHSLANYLPDERDGHVIGFYVVVHDVTEITESRMRLAKEQEALANIIKGTRTGTWEWDVCTDALQVNDHWSRIIGLAPNELVPLAGGDWLSRIHPQDRPRFEESLKRHFEKELDDFECESRIRHESGRWVWVLDRGQVLNWSADGKPLRMYGTHQDIDAIKVAQADASRMGTLLNSVLRAATSVSIIATNEVGTITVFNAGAEQMLGYTAEEMIGRTTPAPLHLASEVAERARELSQDGAEPIEGFRVFVHVAERVGTETRQWTYVRKDGSHLTVQLAVTPVRDVDGVIVGYLGVAQDITERLRQEAELRQATLTAESANAAKSAFLANMSHEIRTPMNAVIGAAYLLESTRLDEEQHQLLKKVQVAGRSLLGIINDVLDLAKIEAGEVQIESAVFSPNEILDDVDQLFGEQVVAKGLEFRIVGRGALPSHLKGDAMRLRQVLVNLVSNAVKFTKEGSVMVWVQQEEPGSHPMWLRWRVRDTGPGIPAQVRDKLFKPFSQADGSITRKFGGTGLGLSIVKQLVEMMGGEVGLESEPGRGSEFWIRLPFEVATEEEGASIQTGALTLLIADDVVVDRRIIGGMCRTLGWRVTELPGGRQLVDHCEQLLINRQPLPDALLVDWHMPEMDGIETLRTLEQVIPNDQLPSVLIITADQKVKLASTDVDKLADGVLIKPVSPSELFNAVNGSVARRTGNSDRVTASTRLTALEGNWLTGVRVLLVDDSEMNLDVGRRILAKEGADVQTCVNGRQAVDLLRNQAHSYDVVLMDVQMPEMDGYTATRLIRGELGLKDLPVLALTAGALSEERRQAEAAGMDAFLTKPLDPAVMIRTVRRAVEKSRGTQQTLPFYSSATSSGRSNQFASIHGIDVNDAALRLGNDAELFQKTLRSLIKEFNASIWHEELGNPEPPDSQTWLRRLHKLKGSAGLLGAKGISNQAAELEQRLAQGESPAVARSDLLRLIEQLQALESSALQAYPDLGLSLGPVASAEIAEITPAQVAVLRLKLQRHDMKAEDLTKPIIDWLRSRTEVRLAEELSDALDRLDFRHIDKLIAQRFE